MLLGLLDYGARLYDPVLGRWTAQDPLSEKYYSWNQYNYCVNNPVMFVDSDGRAAGIYYNGLGQVVGHDGINDDKIYITNYDYINKYDGSSLEIVTEEVINNSTEVEGLIIQTRFKEGTDYTLGHLFAISSESTVIGYTLEPAGPSTAESWQDKRIPEGIYNIDNYSSEKYPDNYVLFNNDVPRYRAILYHIGNTGSDTEGCILPGSFFYNNKVFDSTSKYNELKQFLQQHAINNIKTIITNKIN